MILEPKFDILDLPSEGLFYKNGCNKVKVYHLVLADEEIMRAPNLLQSGEMIDKLMERKVVPVDEHTPYIHPSKMLIGDRLALLIFLRVTMDNLYWINVRDNNGKNLDPYPFDLLTLKMRDNLAKPNDSFEFDFMLPKAKKRVTFRLLTGDDEREIRMYQMRNGMNVPFSKVLRLEKLITSVDGETEKTQISDFVKQMSITDANKLFKYMDEVTPSFDLQIEITDHPQAPNQTIKQELEFTGEFFFPSIGQ